MIDVELLLQPIAGPDPAGVELRSTPVYDEIREARREDDPSLYSGDYQRPLKRADYSVVRRLAENALAASSKDLQLAAWLTEAQAMIEGWSGLRQSLELLSGLVDRFWLSVFPRPDEDGDLEYRIGTIEWLVARLATVVRTLPLTANGFSLAQYEESRAVGYQEDADSSEKEESRNAAIAAKKLTAEQFDSAAARSGQTYYQDLLSQIDGCIENLATLSRVCRQHFERSCPGFGALETPLARLRATTAKFSSAIPYSESVKSSEPEDSNVEREEEETEAPARSSRLSGSRPATGPDEQPPPDRETAFQRILALAEFLRKDDIADPAPYLLVRAMHTGRLRADLAHDPERACIAPASETRRRLLTLSREQQWDDVLREGEEAAAKACGSAWMDVQWYVYKAASELNYETLASALESAAAALIADLPRLSDLMLADGTPAAGFETRQWLIRLTRDVPSVLRQEAASAEPEEESLGGLSPDPYELAMEAMRNGRVADAVGVLWCDSVQAPSGRERFLGRIETARLLMRAGSHRIALPLLDEIAEEIEARRLHQWEPSDVIGGALQLQLQCATALHCPAEQLERIFARMCRVDPVRAMGDGKESHAAGL